MAEPYIVGLPPDYVPGWPGGTGSDVTTTDLPAFPSGLPCPLQTGYGLQHVSPLLRSEMVSGRARQRRIFTSVPTIVSVQWLFSHPQAQAFEAWFRSMISDGAAWFSVTLRTPLGYKPYTARFTSIYQGPRLVAGRYWEVVAELELEERAVLPPPWGEFGVDLIMLQDLIDLALNQEWPEA